MKITKKPITPPYLSRYKVVISHRYIETYQYKEPVGRNLISDQTRPVRDTKPENSDPKIHLSAIIRTRLNITRIIHCNSGIYTDQNGNVLKPYFITFTFKENVHQVDVANREFTNFIKRLNYQVFNSKKLVIKYINVIEFQYKRAKKYNEEPTVHYHTIFFNLPRGYIKNVFKNEKMMNTWGHGIVKIKHIKDGGTGLANYMGKYLTKDMVDKKLIGRKRYFCSRGLMRPIELTREENTELILFFLMMNNTPDYEKIRDSAYQGKIRYRTFNLDDTQLEKIKSMYNA